MILKIALKNLLRNPRRTLASLLTVTLGITAILIYQGFNTGIMNQYRENTIHGYYGYGQILTKNYYGKVYEKPWEHWIADPTETEQKLLQIPGIVQVFPRTSLFAFLNKNGVSLAGKGDGVLPEREKVFFNQMNFISGDYLTQENEIILGKGLADSLNIKVGDNLTLLSQTITGQLNGADLTVSGIFHTGIKAIDDIYFRIHLKQAQHLLETTSVELFSFEVTDLTKTPQVQKEIQEKIPNLELIPFEILDKVYYQNSVDFLDAQFAFIQSIIVLIVALGIFNTISVGLLERAGEVGALRANGESRKRLFKIITLENAILGFVGGITGIILAIVLNKTLLAKGIPMPPGPGITRNYLIIIEIQQQHIVQAMILPVFTAIVAGLLPTMKLLRKKIPDLLRSN